MAEAPDQTLNPDDPDEQSSSRGIRQDVGTTTQGDPDADLPQPGFRNVDAPAGSVSDATARTDVEATADGGSGG